MKYWRVPLDVHEVKIPRGEIHLIVNRCKGCEFCVEFCPNQVLALSTKFNAKGYHPPDIVNPEACTGANLCSALCPDFAIFAQRVKNEEIEDSSS